MNKSLNCESHESVNDKVKAFMTEAIFEKEIINDVRYAQLISIFSENR